MATRLHLSFHLFRPRWPLLAFGIIGQGFVIVLWPVSFELRVGY